MSGEEFRKIRRGHGANRNRKVIRTLTILNARGSSHVTTGFDQPLLVGRYRHALSLEITIESE